MTRRSRGKTRSISQSACSIDVIILPTQLATDCQLSRPGLARSPDTSPTALPGRLDCARVHLAGTGGDRQFCYCPGGGLRPARGWAAGRRTGRGRRPRLPPARWRRGSSCGQRTCRRIRRRARRMRPESWPRTGLPVVRRRGAQPLAGQKSAVIPAGSPRRRRCGVRVWPPSRSAAITTATTSRASSSSIGSSMPWWPWRSSVRFTARTAAAGTSAGGTGNGPCASSSGSAGCLTRCVLPVLARPARGVPCGYALAP
jgi:hypothetical protein